MERCPTQIRRARANLLFARVTQPDVNRSVPVHPVVPPVAAVLAPAAALLETAGLGVRLFDVRGALGQLLSMDLPGSLPRLFVAGVLGSAAVIAALGARL